MKLPPHMRCDITVYLIDDCGLEVAFRLGGINGLPDDVERLSDYAVKSAHIPGVLDNPRPMTEAEVADYLSRQASEADDG